MSMMAKKAVCELQYKLLGPPACGQRGPYGGTPDGTNASLMIFQRSSAVNFHKMPFRTSTIFFLCRHQKVYIYIDTLKIKVCD